MAAEFIFEDSGREIGGSAGHGRGYRGDQCA